jgi:hypothetical protein
MKFGYQSYLEMDRNYSSDPENETSTSEENESNQLKSTNLAKLHKNKFKSIHKVGKSSFNFEIRICETMCRRIFLLTGFFQLFVKLYCRVHHRIRNIVPYKPHKMSLSISVCNFITYLLFFQLFVLFCLSLSMW